MSRLIVYTLLFLVSANIGVWWNVVSKIDATRTATTLYFLDVGQGDSQLVRTSAGNVLIDAGRSSMKALRLLDTILPLSDRVIDVMVLTHPQLDHIGGFSEILKRYDVRLIVHTGVLYPSSAYESFMTAARKKRVPVLYALRGEEIIAGEGRFTVLAPATLLKGVRIPEKHINDTSIVMRLNAEGISALFTGDISAKIEQNLAGLAGDVNILKVSHHGSKYSSDADFLRSIRPEVAVIGVGKNSYGHPAPDALARLAAVGARIFRTDLDGTVTIVVEDGRIQISKAK